MSQAGAISSSGGGGSGNVVGPGSSTNGDIAIFSGTTGKIIADSGVAFPIPPASGGTGVASPTAHTIPIAEGSSNFNFIGPLTNGQLLIGSTGADPAAALPTNGTNISWTGGAGTLTANLTGQVALTNGGTGQSLSIPSVPGVYLESNGSAVQFYSPFQEVRLLEDFCSNNYKSPYDLGWTFASSNGGDHNQNTGVNSGHPGVNQIITGTNTNGEAQYNMNSSFILGGGVLDFYWVIQTPTLSTGGDRYVVNLGLQDAVSNGTPPLTSNGVYLNIPIT